MNESGWIGKAFGIVGITILFIFLTMTLININWWIQEETELVGFEQSYFIAVTKVNNKILMQSQRDMEYAQFILNKEKLNTMITLLVRLDNQVIDNILSQAGVVQIDNTGKQIFPRVLINQTTQGE